MELCKSFVQALAEYAKTDEVFEKFAGKLKSRRKREGILSDAKSIEPMSLAELDTATNPFAPIYRWFSGISGYCSAERSAAGQYAKAGEELRAKHRTG